MMHRMVVEIEEQRPPGEPGLVDHRAGQRVIRGAVFEKRAYFGQGQRRVAHRQHKPQRRKTLRRHPGQQARQQQQMQTPHGDSAAVALAESPQRAVQGVKNIHHRRQQQTPPEGVAQVDKAALPG